jgi:thioredoxin 1
MAQILDVSDDRFDDEVLRAAGPVLVDFGAEWCHPCHQLDPIIAELAGEWDGRIKVVKVDADQNLDTTMRYTVQGLPTLLLFIEGEVKERLTGFQPKRRIMDKSGPYLERPAS